MAEQYVQTTEVHTLYVANDKVYGAAQLMNSLPNGWTLKEFKYNQDNKCWVAIVQEEKQKKS